jgi:hypothetical protein
MTDASARAREILDAIEREAGGRRDALAQERRTLPSIDDVVRREPTSPVPEAFRSAPVPALPLSSSLPPAHPMAVGSPIVVPLPQPADLVPGPQELNALLAGAIIAAPAPQPAPVHRPSPPAAAATAPPTEEAARLLALVDRVVEQTKRVQQRVELMDAAVNALGERLGIDEAALVGAASEVESVAAQEPLEAPDVRVSPAVSALRTARPPAPSDEAPVEPPAASAAAAAAALPAGTRTDGARLVGIEMAVAGYSRGEVEHRLVREYGLADPQSILDDVFGPGSTRDSRMPWGAV